MKTNPPINRCSIESLEARTMLSAADGGVAPILDFSQFNDPEIQCNTGLRRPAQRPCIVLAGRITGQIFDDANGNGVKDAGENGVEGAAVKLSVPSGDSITLMGQRITNSLGEFAFGRLDPGEYRVSVGSSPLRKVEAKSASVTISGVETHTVDIGVKVLSGLIHPPMKVRGTVFFDANRNGLRDKGERVLRGVAAFVDVNGNGKRDSNEPITRSSANGRFSLLAPDRKFKLKFLLPRRYHLQGLLNRGYQIDATVAQDPVEYELGVMGRK